MRHDVANEVHRRECRACRKAFRKSEPASTDGHHVVVDGDGNRVIIHDARGLEPDFQLETRCLGCGRIFGDATVAGLQHRKTEHWEGCDRLRERRAGYRDHSGPPSPWEMPPPSTLPQVPGWTLRETDDPTRALYYHDGCGFNGNTMRANLSALIAQHMQARHDDRP
jgi:hypothetical protein